MSGRLYGCRIGFWRWRIELLATEVHVLVSAHLRSNVSVGRERRGRSINPSVVRDLVKHCIGVMCDWKRLHQGSIGHGFLLIGMLYLFLNLVLL